mmetsp:Transcript_8752/g.35436  ORF Transcript_8752/g.35436 Transcript_8752/m.35436 type:complete len:283 (-) Transcript_8752:465-1313(-)
MTKTRLKTKRKTKRLAPRGIRTRNLQVRPRGPRVLALHEELRRRPRPAPAAKGEAAPRGHRPKLWHARVLPAVLGPNRRDQVPHGAEEPVRQRHHPAVPAPGGREGIVRGAVRAHHHASAHVQGGAHARRRLLIRFGKCLINSRKGFARRIFIASKRYARRTSPRLLFRRVPFLPIARKISHVRKSIAHSSPGMYRSLTSKTTGENGEILGRPGADARPFGNAKSPGMYRRLTPPDRIVSMPSSRPGMTFVSPWPRPVIRTSLGLPFSSELSKICPCSFFAM